MEIVALKVLMGVVYAHAQNLHVKYQFAYFTIR